MKTLPFFSVLLLLGSLACSRKSSATADPAVITGGTQTTTTAIVPLRIVIVRNASELNAALSGAHAGDEIRMVDGNYNGKFVIPTGVNGTADHPVVLTGSRSAVLDAGSIQTGYVLYLQSSYWQLKGFRITNGLKGLMVDGVRNCVMDSLKIDHIGEEALHLRKFSSQNEVRNCDISYTGLKTPDYGEGIYIGSAYSNWPNYTNGNPDLCDSNRILNNIIGPQVAAECIDVKEGTTGGLIKGNHFNSDGITGANSADSWMDVKGNGYLIDANIGYNPGGSIFVDGFQVHVAYVGWGNNNVFTNNQCAVNAAGYGVLVKLTSSAGTATGNKVYSNNQVTGAASGVSNITLSN